MNVGGNAIDRFDSAFNMGDSFFPVFPFFVMVVFEILLKRHIHSEDLFLVDLHPPTYVEAAWGHVKPRRRDYIFSTHEYTGTLWPTNRFTSGYGHDIKTHVVELPKI